MAGQMMRMHERHWAAVIAVIWLTVAILAAI
jgi:hypothetical protein